MNTVSSVYVNGFDFGTSEQELKSHMSKVGKVVAIEMKKGNAVVTYSTPAMAKRAEETLNKSTVMGNARFLDVWLDKKSLPAGFSGGGVKRSFSGKGGPSAEGGSRKVLVRGFDFGTTDEQVLAHMGRVGTPEEVFWITKGSANIIYSTADEATAAIQQLNKSVMDGNERYIDVIPGGDLSAAKRFKGGGKGKFSFGKGSFGKGSGKRKGGDHSDEDPVGGGRVFVKGFDFGTTDDQLESYMSSAGPIHAIHWVNQGNAVVVYKSKQSAIKANSILDRTTIPGNSRYIEVMPR